MSLVITSPITKNRTFATKQDQNRTTFLKKVRNQTFAGKPDQSGGTVNVMAPYHKINDFKLLEKFRCGCNIPRGRFMVWHWFKVESFNNKWKAPAFSNLYPCNIFLLTMLITMQETYTSWVKTQLSPEITMTHNDGSMSL